MVCVIKNSSGTRQVRYAEPADLDWMVSAICRDIAVARNWNRDAVKLWVDWFIRHHLACVLVENGQCRGLAMGRPCQDVWKAGTDWYSYDPEGEIIWVDAVIAPDKSAVSFLWRFCITFAHNPTHMAYCNKGKPEMRVQNARRMYRLFKQAELN